MTINPFAFPAPAGATYDFTETFDATGFDQTGWGTDGTTDNNYTTAPAPLEGTQSFRMTGGGADLWRAISGDSISVYRQVRGTNIQTFEAALRFYDSGFTAVLSQNYFFAGHILSHGSTEVTGGSTPSANTTYHIWHTYEKGTGSNGRARMYVSTTGTKPGSPTVEVTTGTATGSLGYLYLYGHAWSGDVGSCILDRVVINAGFDTIGSNP